MGLTLSPSTSKARKPLAEGQLIETGHLESDSIADSEVSRDGKPVSLVVPWVSFPAQVQAKHANRLQKDS